MDGGSGKVDEMADPGLERPMNSIVGLEARGHDGDRFTKIGQRQLMLQIPSREENIFIGINN